MRHLVYSVTYYVVPINSSLLTITLYSAVRLTFVHNDKIFSPSHDVITKFDCNYLCVRVHMCWVFVCVCVCCCIDQTFIFSDICICYGYRLNVRIWQRTERHMYVYPIKSDVWLVSLCWMGTTYNRDVRISAINHTAGPGSRQEYVLHVGQNVLTALQSGLSRAKVPLTCLLAVLGSPVLRLLSFYSVPEGELWDRIFS
jgi:hypothetical protein